MSDVDFNDLLVDKAEAREKIRACLNALDECPENEMALADWHDETEKTLAGVFASPVDGYFTSNSGFGFSYYWDGRSKKLHDYNIDRARGILRRILKSLEIDDLSQVSTLDEALQSAEVSTDVFIVHGHSERHLSEVARVIEKLGLNPIILREQPNRGYTVIEKFERCADVGFAVVIMTGDDLGGKFAEKLEEVELKRRARQNVILELGYFVGKLSRSRVCVLKESSVEEPSDIHGVVYTPIDEQGRWKFDLVKELRACGYRVSADSIM